jgi:UDP-glucose:(heptosyl)LPS alpha-1,3-glucosyltransferase
MVGSKAHTKGLDRAIRALKALSQHPGFESRLPVLLVIGKRPNSRYLWQIRRFGLEQQIYFIPQQDDLSMYMQAADMLIHLPRWEMAGMVLLEALAHGLPVLTSAIAGYAEHVQQSGAGVVLSLPFSQTYCNSQLITMLEQPQLLKKQATQGLRYARKQDWDPQHATKRAVDIIEA